MRVPDLVFKTRVRDESIGGDNPYRWEDVTISDLFTLKKCVVFSLPGAFTPTCSTMQVPGFEEMAPQFYERGVDEIYCVSVNDTFVMNKWAQLVVDGGLKHVKVIPDGNGHFTEAMGMLVCKNNLGFGNRSWRYAMVVEDGEVTGWFEEPGMVNNCEEDPYGETSPENVLKYLDSDS